MFINYQLYTQLLFHFYFIRIGLFFKMCEVNPIESSKLTSLDFGVQESQLTEIHVNINRNINENKFYIMVHTRRKFRKHFWLNIVAIYLPAVFPDVFH